MIILKNPANINRDIVFAPNEESTGVNVYLSKTNPKTKEVSSKKLILTLNIDPKDLDNALVSVNSLKIYKPGKYNIDCSMNGTTLVINDFYATSLYPKDLDIGIENKKTLSSAFHHSTISDQSVFILFQSISKGAGIQLNTKRPLVIKYKVPATKKSEKFTLTMTDLNDKKEFLLQYPYLTYKFQTDKKGFIEYAEQITQTLNNKVQRTIINDPEIAQKIFFDAFERTDTDLRNKINCNIFFAYKNHNFKPTRTERVTFQKEFETKIKPQPNNVLMRTLAIFSQYISKIFPAHAQEKHRKEVLGKWQQRQASREFLSFFRDPNTK